MRCCFILLCWCLLWGAQDVCAAGLKAAAQTLKPEAAWNPRPADDDLELPMPCGLKMVMRAVAVPAGGYLYDKKFFMGVGELAGTGRDFYERRFEAHITAPFTQEDVPSAWHDKLPADEKSSYFYYFLGKYEVTALQWLAVMENVCPKETITQADALPKADISWYDVQEFFKKYTTWLLQHHKDALPRFPHDNKNIAFLRLPTEEEWEYAARGGSKVPEEYQLMKDYHPLDGGQLADFGIFRTKDKIYDGPAVIGNRRANPLGMYDMSGNVAEMVQSAFRFSIPDENAGAPGGMSQRLHGSSGGFVIKGGSFATGEAEILPGRREEMPLFTEQGPAASRTMGFRLLLTGINTPGGDRLKIIAQEQKEAAKGQRLEPAPATPLVASPKTAPGPTEDVAVQLDPLGNPLQELNKVQQATVSPVMRENLEQLQILLEKSNSVQQRQRDALTANRLRAMLYQTETLRNIAVRFCILEREYLERQKQRGAEGNVRFRGTMREFLTLLENATTFYTKELLELGKTAPEALERHLLHIRKEYAGKTDLLSTHMRENMAALEQHLTLMRRKGGTAPADAKIWQDILAPAMFKSIQTWRKEFSTPRQRGG